MTRKYCFCLLLCLFCVVMGGTPAWGQADLPPDFPALIIRSQPDAPPGRIYLAPFTLRPEDERPFSPYLIQLNSDGTVAQFQRPDGLFAIDYTRQPTGVDSYYVVELWALATEAEQDAGYFQTLDGEGKPLRRYLIQNERYHTDAHQFRLETDGSYWLMSYHRQPRDLQAIGGHEAANVVELVLQHVSVTDEVLFEWRSWEHFAVTDATRDIPLDTAPPAAVDYVHANSFSFDLDGHLLLSSRNMDEVTKINRDTGEIIWRMGGPANDNNEFSFIDDPYQGFSHQHSIHILPNGNLLLFDNGNLHRPPTTRAVEYALDQDARTATLVWAYEADFFSSAMGSVQRLPNGNTLIGWGLAGTGENPAITEVTPQGEVVLEVFLPAGYINYAAYHFAD